MPLPFDTIKFKHPIDDACVLEGEGSQRSQEQNKMKNNFCASGTPKSVTVATFKQIQNALSFAAGGPNSPAPDRSIYQVALPSGTTYKEGDLVRWSATSLTRTFRTAQAAARTSTATTTAMTGTTSISP